MLKFALTALVLAAGATAYAQETTTGPVTLGNGTTTVTWAQFAAAVNNPNSIVAPNVTLPDDDETVTALAAANQKLEAAKEAAKNPTVENEAELKGKIETAEGAYNTAKTDSTTYAGYTATAEGTLNDAIATLKLKTDKYSADSLKILEFNDSVTAYNAKLSEYSTDLSDLNTELNAVPFSKRDSIVNVDWLQKNIEAVTKYYKTFNIAWQGGVDPVLPIYYYTGTVGMGNNKSTTLFLSFVKPESETLSFGDKDVAWLTAKKPTDLYAALHPKDVMLNISTVYVYLNSGYKSNNGNLTLTNFDKTSILDILLAAETQITALKTNVDYIVDTIQIKTYSKDNQAKVDSLNREIASVQNKQANTRIYRTNANNKIESLTNSNATLKTEIDNFRSGELKTAQDAYDQAVKNQEPYNEAYATAITNLFNARQNLANAQAEAQTAADQAVVTAQADADKADADYKAALKAAQDDANDTLRGYYTDVTLNDDVVATAPITQSISDVTINGGGHILTIALENATQTTLFKRFTGHINNLAINGAFATSTQGGSFDNVARWNSDAEGSKAGVYYNEQGTGTNYSDLYALGFAARDNFGVSNNALTTATADTKVYSITTFDYDGENVTPSLQYVTASNGKFYSKDNAAGFVLKDNQFAQSGTNDLTGFDNVYYTENGLSTCDNVVIKDNVDFYCPVNLTAKNVTYKRDFVYKSDNYGMNALCLPFAVPASAFGDGKDIRSICTFEKIDYETQKFWFINTGKTIPANTPVLLLTEINTPVTSIELGTTSIPQTTKQIVVSEGNTEDESVCYGTLVNATKADLNGESEVDFIYGLTKNNKFQAAADNANISAFRMMVGTHKSVMARAPRRSPAEYISEFSIGILDEDGNDITNELSGIESVASDAQSFSVTTAQGEIIINSDADYGKVEIYTVDGRLAAVANVTVGTTTVNVQSGIYIVMGKKVMVK